MDNQVQVIEQLFNGGIRVGERDGRSVILVDYGDTEGLERLTKAFPDWQGGSDGFRDRWVYPESLRRC